MRTRALVIACGIFPLIALGAKGAAAEDPPVDESVRRELQAVRKVKLEIRQEYEKSEFDEDEETKPRTPAPADSKGFLPLLALATEMTKAAGWELAPRGEEGDVILRVDVTGAPLGGSYTNITGGPTGYHYTGARLDGTIGLEKAGRVLIERSFEAVEPLQHTISRSYPAWSDAPFHELLPEYCGETWLLLGQALGVPPLLKGLEHRDGDIREGALRALVALGDPAAAPAFARLAADKSDDVGRLAAWGAGALGVREALPALLEALRAGPSAPAEMDDIGRRTWLEISAEREPPEDRPDSVRAQLAGEAGHTDRRQAILWALMQIDAPEMKERLRAALRDPNSAEFRANAALLLGWSEGAAARDALLAASRDADALVRAAVVVVLPAAGDDEVLAPLLDAAGDADALVRELAREGLDEAQRKRWDSHVASSGIRPVHAAHQNRPFIAKSLGHEDPLIRVEALELAVAHDLRGHLPAIHGIARQDKLPFLRRAALEALADQHDPQSVEAAIAGLGDSVKFVRQQALKVLSGDASEWEQSAPPALPESVVEPLLKLANTEGNEDPDLVLGMLQRVEGEAGVRAIERLAREAGPVPIRRQAMRLLARIRPEQSWPLLLEVAAQTQEGELAQVLRECLGEISHPAMLDPLIALLKSDRRESRRLAAGVLGRLKQPRAVGPLVAALQVAEAAGPGGDELLASSARDSLRALTGVNLHTAVEWRAWWKENAARLNAR